MFAILTLAYFQLVFSVWNVSVSSILKAADARWIREKERQVTRCMPVARAVQDKMYLIYSCVELMMLILPEMSSLTTTTITQECSLFKTSSVLGTNAKAASASDIYL